MKKEQELAIHLEKKNSQPTERKTKNNGMKSTN